MDTEIDSGSNPSMEIERYVPSSNDPGWKYAYLASKLNPNVVTCGICGKIIRGWINRLKQHLAHIKGNVASCLKVPDDVRKEIQNYMDNVAKKKHDKSVDLDELRDSVNIKASSSIGSGSIDKPDLIREGKRPRASLESIEEEKQMHQPTIKDVFSKEKRARVNKYVAKFFYDCNIAFNVVTHKSFIRMCEAIGQYGSGYKAPSYYEISETLLKDEVLETKEFLRSHEAAWKKYGCSIMTDAWTDMRGRSIMNLCVNSDMGTCFLKSIDSSTESHTAEYIFSLVDDCIKEVGAENVVQVVTDNASANLAAGRILKTKYPQIFWSSCAAHCIDLMLEEFGKEAKIKSAITKARTLTTFIYSHAKTLSLMRQFTQKGEIVRPGQTRFATTFLTLESVMDKKERLRLMFSSDEWRGCKWSRTRKGETAASIVFSATFWNQVSLAIRVFLPLVYVLRIVDGDQKPSLGFIYGALLDAKKEIKAIFKDVEAQYKPFIEAIESKSKGRLDSPLHVAAYYLNPFYYYRDEIDDGIVLNGFLECIDTFYPDLEVQDIITRTELIMYQNGEGTFGKPLAVKQRLNNDELFNPGNWWKLHGADTPYLKAMAMRILKLTSSSSGCERNWSSFEAIHTKKRNKLEMKRLNDLVFVKFNSKLKERQQTKGKDPLATKDRTYLSEWIAEGEEDEEVFPGSGLTWNLVSEASGAEELVQHRRSQRNLPSTSLAALDEEDEDDLLTDDESDDDIPDAEFEVEWESD